MITPLTARITPMRTPPRISGSAAHGVAPKLRAISTSERLICITPARALRMMIHTANRVVVVTMIDFMLKPNRTIRTGTSAVRGALRKMFTQGSSSSSSRFFPIRIPTGIPMATAENTPARNACAVSDSAFWKAAVPAMAKNVAMTSDSGGRKNVSPPHRLPEQPPEDHRIRCPSARSAPPGSPAPRPRRRSIRSRARLPSPGRARRRRPRARRTASPPAQSGSCPPARWRWTARGRSAAPPPPWRFFF